MSEKINTIKKSILDVILTAEAYNAEKKFVNLDKIWESPEYLKVFCPLLANFIKENYKGEKFSGIITVDTWSYPFGPIPLVSNICADTNLSLGIIKEGNDPITGKHGTYGVIPSENSLFIYDVTRYGLTAARMLSFLNSENRFPLKFLSLVDFAQGALGFLEKTTREKFNQRCDFQALLNINEVATKTILS